MMLGYILGLFVNCMCRMINDIVIMNDEFEKTGQKAVMAYLRHYTTIFMDVLNKTTSLSLLSTFKPGTTRIPLTTP
jgi:hypothetical protein